MDAQYIIPFGIFSYAYMLNLKNRELLLTAKKDFFVNSAHDLSQ
jgi:hypothetical protein